MDERQIGLALILKEIRMSGDVSDFDSRLILQKLVYLLEEAGIRLGYTFTWYLRGPYSPALTRDLYDLASSSGDIANWVLDGQSKATLSRIEPLLTKSSSEDRSERARGLELLASLHYLSRRRKVNLDNLEDARAELARNGKRFTADEIGVAIQELRQAELL